MINPMLYHISHINGKVESHDGKTFKTWQPLEVCLAVNFKDSKCVDVHTSLPGYPIIKNKKFTYDTCQQIQQQKVEKVPPRGFVKVGQETYAVKVFSI